MQPPPRIGFTLRAMALAIDHFILLFVSSDTARDVLGISHLLLHYMEPSFVSRLQGIMEGFFTLIILLFYLLLEAFTGLTPAKLLLGLRVGTAGGQAGNRKLYFIRSLARSFYVWLLLMVTVLEWIDIHFVSGSFLFGLFALSLCSGIVILFSDNRALHDFIASSAVYQKSATN